MLFVGRCLVLVGAVILFSCVAAVAETEYDVQQKFEEMMDLWSNQKYEELWEGGTEASRESISQEDFVTVMKRSHRIPDVGWLREREISVSMKNPSSATVKARIGFIINGQDTPETRLFQLVKEDEEWKILLTELVGLAKPLEYGY
jgi:hypothetical protein